MKTDDPEVRKESWRFSREISISNVVTIISVLGTVLVFGSNLNTRLSLNEEAVKTLSAADVRQYADLSEVKATIKENQAAIHDDIKDIGHKVDKLTENVLVQKSK